jgi:hypothetical protein
MENSVGLAKILEGGGDAGYLCFLGTAWRNGTEKTEKHHRQQSSRH